MTDPHLPQRHRPVIRVFVSSTFSDLKHGRTALQTNVWPELERYCQQRGFQFQAIDLRWGVPTEAGLDHRTMRICFDELRRSQETSPRPNFLILLRDRYGWRPLPEEITTPGVPGTGETGRRRTGVTHGAQGLVSARRQRRTASTRAALAARFPTALFQAVQNDRGLAIADPDAAAATGEGAVATQPQLAALLQAWEAIKQSTTPGFRHLRRLTAARSQGALLSLPVHRAAVSRIDLHPREAQILTAGQDGRAVLTDLATGGTTWTSAFDGPLAAAVLSPCGRRVAVLVRKPHPNQNMPSGYRLPSDRLLRPFVDRNVDVRDVLDDEYSVRELTQAFILKTDSGVIELELRQCDCNYRDIAWNADGTQLITCGNVNFGPGRCTRWDAETGEELVSCQLPWHASVASRHTSGTVLVGVLAIRVAARGIFNRSVFAGGKVQRQVIPFRYPAASRSGTWRPVGLSQGILISRVECAGSQGAAELVGIDLHTNEEAFAVLCPPVLARATIRCCDLVLEQSRLVIGLAETCVVLSTRSGEELGRFTGPSAVTSCRLHADGQRVISADESGWVHEWVPQNGPAIIDEPDRQEILDCDFAGDGTYYVSVGRTGLRVWDAEQHEPRMDRPLRGANCCRIAPDSRTVVVGLCRPGFPQIRCAALVGIAPATPITTLWRIPAFRGRGMAGRVLPGLTFAAGCVLLVVLSIASYYLDKWLQIDASAGLADQRLVVKLYHILSLALFGILVMPLFSTPFFISRLLDLQTNACEFSRDGSTVFTGDRHHLLRLWSLRHGRAIPLRVISVGSWLYQWANRETARPGGVESLCLMNGATRLLAGSRYGGIQVLDAGSGAVIQQLTEPGRRTHACDYHAASGRCAGVVDGRRVVLWQLDEAGRFVQLAATVPERLLHGGELLRMRFSPAGTLLAACSGDGWLLIWDCASLQLVGAHHAASRINCLAWHPSGSELIIGDARGAVNALRCEGFTG
jgi:WD40 repeat protein